MAYHDRVLSDAVTANGTGNATWTTSVVQYALPPTGISETVSYTILDSGGSAWETGQAALAESGGTYTLTRGGSQIVIASSTGSAISLTNSSAHTLFLTPNATRFKPQIAEVDTVSNSGWSDGSTNTLLWTTEVRDDPSVIDLVSDSDRMTIPSGSPITKVEHHIFGYITGLGAGSAESFEIAVIHYNSSDVEQSRYSVRRTCAGGSWCGESFRTKIFSVAPTDYFIVTVYASDFDSPATFGAGRWQMKVLA